MIEDVNGTVIGEILMIGQVFYDGRPQGPQVYGIDGQEIRENAERVINYLKKDCGQALNYIYPDESAWELRIYQ